MRVVGLDVWKGRWVVVALRDGCFDSAAVALTFAEAVGAVPDAVVVGADIPLTVPGPGERRPEELAARAFIGPRGRSLFLTPPGDVLAAPSHEAANRLARTQGLGGVSAQSYALSRLVLEALPVAAADARVREVHPEGSFVVADGGRHLAWAKTTWNGMALRRRILEGQGISIPDDLGPAGGAGITDVLDAAIVAWTAHRIATGVAERFASDAGAIGAIWR